MIYTLVYYSKATQEMSEEDLVDLLVVSRRNNISLNISGMLLYRNGEFIQALEGDKILVENLFEKISNDPRHKEILVLSRKEIPERVFESWSMGFENLSGSALSELEGYSDFIDTAFSDPYFKQSETAYNLLKKFVANG